MAHWLFKTEPAVYAWEDLVRDGRTVWDGVANALALKNLRQAKRNDTVLVYHTGDVRAAVGLARIARDAYVDPKLGDPGRVVVDLVPDRPLARPVTLATMRSAPALAGFDLLRLSRLSVVPVSAAHLAAILRLAGAGR